MKMKKGFKKILAGLCLVPCMLMATACFGKVDQDEGYSMFKTAVNGFKDYNGTISYVMDSEMQIQGTGFLDINIKGSSEEGFDETTKQYYSIDKLAGNVIEATFVEPSGTGFVKYGYTASILTAYDPIYTSDIATAETSEQFINDSLSQLREGLVFSESFDQAKKSFQNVALNLGEQTSEEDADFSYLSASNPKKEKLEISKKAGKFEVDYEASFDEVDPSTSANVVASITLKFTFDEEKIYGFSYNILANSTSGEGLEKMVVTTRVTQKVSFDYSFVDKTLENYTKFPAVTL
jgi:hypothetical protein